MLVPSVALLVGAVVVSPPSVPAKGAQEAFVELDQAAMVLLEAKGPAGAACTLVDARRGPFASAGEAGREECRLELLLDPGRYKLRLQAPAKGSGELKLSAKAFEEVNGRPQLLVPGAVAAADLRAGQQASFWIHRDAPGHASLRVLGRTAGQVLLWHDGSWLQPHDGADARPQPKKDRPIHEWAIEEELPAGDTRVTVYGTGPLRWTAGEESDRLAVALEAPAAPEERLAEVELPSWGQWALELPAGAVAALLRVSGERSGDVALELESRRDDGRPSGGDGGCVVRVKDQPAGCAAFGRRATVHRARVRGAPGTKVALQWMPLRSGTAADGEAVPASSDLTFRAGRGGEHLVGVRELPSSIDDPPLSCALLRERKLPGGSSWEPIARSYLPVSSRQPFERSFNYRSGGAELWIELGDWGLYTVEASGGLGSSCLLLREDDGGGTEPVARSEDKARSCKLTKLLAAGRYQLRVVGGTSGIETLRIGSVTSPVQPAPPRTTCRFRAPLDAGTRYRVLLSRHARAEALALAVRPLPLELERPLLVDLDPEEALRLPVAGGGEVEAAGGAEAAFACGPAGAEGSAAAPAAVGGRCAARLAAGEELSLYGRGAAPASIAVRRPQPPPRPPAPLAEASPRPQRPPELEEGKPLFLDLGRGEARTLVFTVREGGLWELATQGLLATACALRTPAVPALAEDQGSGRGRNCLVSGVLSPGRYAATVRALDRSRGRLSVLLTRRPAREGPALASGAEAFFRAPPGELVRERVRVPSAGRYRLSAAAQGARLACRLEDSEGWPLLPAPADCSRELALPAGELLLSQLPLTVESQRHAALARVRPPVLLRGAAPHRIALNQRYDARLDKRGFDQLRFRLEAPLVVEIELTAGMQGRLYRGKERTPIEVVPPQGGGEVAEAPGGEIEAAPPEAAEEAPPAGEEASAGPCEGDECEAQQEAREDAGAARARAEEAAQERRAAEASRRPRAQAGTGPLTLSLAPGDYLLRTEHSRADVAVAYQVAITTRMVAPGLATEVDVPSRGALSLPLVMPRAGTLRLRTEGESDVRCRLFRGPRLIAASDDDGDDWNCAITEPLQAGTYLLSIESQTLTAGRTRVVAALPPDRDLGVLAPGPEKLGSEVLTAWLPPAADDTVQEVRVTAAAPFSCALEDEAGALRFHPEASQECALLLRGGLRHRLRLWGAGRTLELAVAIGARPVVASEGGALEPGTAARVQVPRPGRWATGEGLFCLGGSERGLLRPCGPEASLEAGPAIFAPLGLESAARLSLEERTAALPAEREEAWELQARARLQRLRSDGPALHLLALRVPPGAQARPACALVADGLGSARALTDEACFAAAGLAGESVARALSGSGESGQAGAVLRAVPLPPPGAALAAGSNRLALRGPAARFPLPAGPARLELLLPEQAWAVLLDPRGGAADLCAPAEALSRCTLLAEGGELAIWSPREPRAEVSVLQLAAAPAAPELSAAAPLHEALPAEAGTATLRVLAEAPERRLAVDGAVRCVLELAGGARQAGCRQPVPAGAAAILRVIHQARPYRAALSAPGAEAAALAGAAGPQAPGELPRLEPGRALPLLGAGAVERRLELDRELLVHLRATGGACALRDAAGAVLAEGGPAGGDAAAGGCRLARLLPKGTYRATVRPFAGAPLTGELSLTTEEPALLGEGVAAERWIAPGEVQLMRFTTASAGRIGLGLQAPADLLACAVLDDRQQPLGSGCQQLIGLPQGSFLLEVRAPAGAPPLRYRPVLLGLSGASRGVPEEIVREMASRLGETP